MKEKVSPTTKAAPPFGDCLTIAFGDKNFTSF
jgi:hypothetical protein